MREAASGAPSSTILEALCSGRPLVPRLEDGELHRRIRLRRAGQEVEAADRADDIDAGRTLQDIAHLLGDLIGALQRGAVRQLDDDEEIALVFDRQERRGDAQRNQIGRAERRRRTAPASSSAGGSARARHGHRRATAGRSRALNQRNGANCASPRWRRKAALSAGLSVSELNAEIPTEIATVSAN